MGRRSGEKLGGGERGLGVGLRESGGMEGMLRERVDSVEGEGGGSRRRMCGGSRSDGVGEGDYTDRPSRGGEIVEEGVVKGGVSIPIVSVVGMKRHSVQRKGREKRQRGSGMCETRGRGEERKGRHEARRRRHEERDQKEQEAALRHVLINLRHYKKCYGTSDKQRARSGEQQYTMKTQAICDDGKGGTGSRRPGPSQIYAEKRPPCAARPAQECPRRDTFGRAKCGRWERSWGRRDR